ncbi:F-type H+-transporting ATPase subunit b [Planctomycetaceae bacterium]|nr:F-type H+-transporting ATPase subunit b [Planctomycetaceae bacterium]
MLEINPGLILWTILTFVIVLVILQRTAWKPLLTALKEREDSIRTSLHTAEEARNQAQKLLDENRKLMASAEEQSQRIIKEGRDMAERLKAEILEKANASSQQMVVQAREEIQREKESALTQLRSEVADLAITAAGKILDANLDPAKQRAIVDAAIRDINKG